MSAALTRGWRKGVRTLAQLAAGGALTALISAIVGGLNPSVQAVVMGAWTALVAAAQNYLETAGKIPTLLPTSGTVPSRGVAPVAVGTVATSVEAAGDDTSIVVGTVTGQEGETLGEVSGVFNDEGTTSVAPGPGGGSPREDGDADVG